MPRHHHLREKPQQLTEPPAGPGRLLERRRSAGKVKSLGISPPRGSRTPRPLSSLSWTWGNLPIRDRSRPGAAAPSAAGRTNGHHPDQRAGVRAGGAAGRRARRLRAGAPGSHRPPEPGASSEPAPATLPGPWTPPSTPCVPAAGPACQPSSLRSPSLHHCLRPGWGTHHLENLQYPASSLEAFRPVFRVKTSYQPNRFGW